MDLTVYNDIKSFINQYRGLSRFCLRELINLYPSIPRNTLGSICSLQYQIINSHNHYKLKNNAKRLYRRFTGAVAEGETPGIIIRLAQEVNVCPALVARSILAQYYIDNNLEDNGEFASEKVFVTTMMKDTSSINDRDLALEVFLSVMYDDQYGPVADSIKHCIGADYEEVLKAKLRALGVSFKDESVLRARGYDKTPDVKLDFPLAIANATASGAPAIVNWIESKALFADAPLHAQYATNQYVSYWNRFGPGLVIYWFGCTEDIIKSPENRFIVRNDVPENLVFMNPSIIKAPSLL
ncbi:CDAN1-interacting nuclease 1 [Nilaparvata lugens]|uniref:CDAN1-interacting nuclease 1 n=1 Tax=Nilaparvata lugens TaxID=108931 RepID=UPI000B98C0C9|nr:CDAN1-interacting nuclease 1 [Nilaparvata lugens]